MKYNPTTMLVAVTVACLSIAALPYTQRKDPRAIQQRYGIQGAYTDTTTHPDGRRSTVVPVTLEDGRTGHLVIPQDTRPQDPHAMYYRDSNGDFHPVRVTPNVTRQQVIQSPRVARFQPEPQHRNKQSWEKDALIVGGSAGAGALIGAVAKGGKGAAVGATAGGIGGLIYDLATRHK